MAYIAVVDDEESIRRTFAILLEREGHRVGTADNFEAGLKLIAEHNPDCVFADILLGEKTGVDLLREVKLRGFDGPFIVITGFPSIETASEALRLGAFDYAAKPVNKEALLRVTRNALAHKQLADQKLRAEREKDRLRRDLEALFQSVSDAVLVFEETGVVGRANQALWEVLGVNPGDAVNRAVEEVFRAGLAPLCSPIREVLHSKRAVKNLRFECIRPDSRLATYSASVSPIWETETKTRGAAAVIRDVTVLAGLERALKEKKGERRMIGKSKALTRVLELIDDLADADTTVLITGPSGTGKELAAEALHFGGVRGERPLVKVNCSALSEHLLESELFGHVRGAFTGAIKDKVGRFKLAHGGTIFLDEIGDISQSIQLKLLRVLQEKEFERVGDSETMRVDVRVIAATNRDLRKLAAEGLFREDLFYRLKVVELLLPGLADRREDIPLLLEHFITDFNLRFHKSIQGLTEAAMGAVLDHPWPGNIRELKHAVEHAFILCRGDRIGLEHLPAEVVRARRDGPAPGPTDPSAYAPDSPEALAAAIERAGGNKAKAARLLGVSRQTVYRRLSESGAK